MKTNTYKCALGFRKIEGFISHSSDDVRIHVHSNDAYLANERL